VTENIETQDIQSEKLEWIQKKIVSLIDKVDSFSQEAKKMRDQKYRLKEVL
jgi:hypothetical protein